MSDFMISFPMKMEHFQRDKFEPGEASGEMAIPLSYIIESVAKDYASRLDQSQVTRLQQLIYPE